MDICKVTELITTKSIYKARKTFSNITDSWSLRIEMLNSQEDVFKDQSGISLNNIHKKKIKITVLPKITD
mgnify:CR=1 FL=1